MESNHEMKSASKKTQKKNTSAKPADIVPVCRAIIKLLPHS